MLDMRFSLPPATGYLVAVSGGADSRLLLELTVRALRDCPPGTRLMAAHLHHGIRGEEADRDEAFCRAVCAASGVPLVVERVDIPALSAASGRSEETEARVARYDFFLRTLKEQNIPVLLTAHNADDQLETLLHRLLRGSGTRGMGGIPQTRPLTDAPDAPMVHRPLLGMTKREILAACEALGLAFVTDRTNLEDNCTRNRLRHGVIPTLEAIAGEDIPQRAAVRLSEASREDEEALTAIAAARLRAACESPPQDVGGHAGGQTTISPSVAAIAAEPTAIAKRMILAAYAASAHLTADTTLSAYHVEQLLTLCRTGHEGKVSDLLPDGLRAMVCGGRLVFTRMVEAAGDPPLPRALPEGDTVWDAGGNNRPRITIRVERGDAKALPPLVGAGIWASAIFPPTVLPLWARPREAGDVILSHGLHKKVKKLLCDHRIPPELRDRLPLVCTGNLQDALWFPGVAFRDGFPAPTEGDCLRMTIITEPLQQT